MPVEQIVIKNFSGGLVTYFDALDIKPEEFQTFQDVMNDTEGKLKPRLANSIYVNDIGGVWPQFDIQSQLFGYFTKHNAAGTQAETWWRIFLNSNKNVHRQTGSISIQSDTVNYVSVYGDARYTAQDGVLRIYDNGNSASLPSWFGCLKGKKFFNNNFTWGTNDSASSEDDSGYGSAGGGWYGAYTEVRKPTVIATRTFTSGNAYVSGAGIASIPTDRYGIMITGKTVSSASNVGFTNDEAFNLFCTLEYDGSQESQPVYANPATWSTWLWNSGSGYSSVSLQIAVNKKINKRVSAIKLYRRDKTKKSKLDNGDMTFLAKIDINGGIEAEGGDANWTNTILNTGGAGDYLHRIAVNLTKEDIENATATYYSETGLEQNEDPDSMTIKQVKSVLIANNRTFVGGFSYTDDSGNNHIYSDRVVYSPVNRYDTLLPNVYYIDVGSNDGDDITALAFWKGILLVFKKRRVYMLDISSADTSEWKFIDKYDQAGAYNQNYVTTTPYGIVFGDQNQITLSTGDEFKEISLPIKDLWQTTWTLQGGIAYHKKMNIVISMLSTGYGYYYSFINNSWCKYTAANIFGYSTAFLYDESINDLSIITYNDEGNHWISIIRLFSTGNPSSPYFTTKSFSLESPQLDKKWLNMYITYKGSISAYWYKNGATSASISGTGSNSAYAVAKIALNKTAKVACMRVDLKSASTEIYKVAMTVRPMRGLI